MRRHLLAATVAILGYFGGSDAKAQAWASPYAWGGSQYNNSYGGFPYMGGYGFYQQMPGGGFSYSGPVRPMYRGYVGRYSPSPALPTRYTNSARRP